MKSRYLFRMIVLLLGLQLSVTAAAQPSQPAGERGHRQSHAEKNRPAGLDRAVSRIRNRTGGRVLRAETRGRDGDEVHVIRILTKDGRVQKHKVDAATGRTLPRSGRR